MPFTIMPNVAQYGGADWSNFIKTVSGCTPQSAQRIAMADPAIAFFFHCRTGMVLPGHPPFMPGDAVFFSGTPWPGSAPQADIYQKSFVSTAYVETNSNEFANAGCYLLQDGRQLLDFACIFAANINADRNNNPLLYLNPSVSRVLDATNDVKTLQGLGISVLLTVLGNHQNAGWSCFTDQTVAQTFARQLADVVTQYGLDGIDIDDEYSTCAPNDTSLIMVTTAMRQAMPGKIISKALFDDLPYFDAKWNGHTLAGNLTYGWEMTYGAPDYARRVRPYLVAGMGKDRLAIGVSTAGSDGAAAAGFVRNGGCGGIMVYDVTRASASYLSAVSNVLYGESTVAKPGCLS